MFQNRFNDGNVLGAQISDHLKCGEVYTWLCAEELYAVECKLCEDHPLCSLSEFPQHMEVWHTDWQEEAQKDEGDNTNSHFTDDEEKNPNLNDHNDDDINGHALSFTMEDSKSNDQLQNESITTHHEKRDHHVQEILEPFEQVLIEQDMSIESIHITEDINKEEYFEDINEQVAEIKHCRIEENQPKQKQIFFANQTLKKRRENEQRVVTNDIRENERDIQYLTEIKGRDKVPNVNENNFCKFQIRSINNEQLNENIPETSDNETSDEEDFKSRRTFRKPRKFEKGIQENLIELKKIKQSLRKIVRAISDLKGFGESESETSDTEKIKYQHVSKFKNFKVNYLKRIKTSSNSDTEREMSENETSKFIREIMETKNESEIIDNANKNNRKQVNQIRNSPKIEKNNVNKLHQNKKYSKEGVKKLRNTMAIETIRINKTERNVTKKGKNETNESKTSTNKRKTSENEGKRSECTKREGELGRKTQKNISPQLGNFRKSKRLEREPSETIQKTETSEMKLEIKANKTSLETSLQHRNGEITGGAVNKNQKAGIGNERELTKNEAETELSLNEIELSENNTKLNKNEPELNKHLKCLQEFIEIRERVESCLKRKKKSRDNFEQNKKQFNVLLTEDVLLETAGIENETGQEARKKETRANETNNTLRFPYLQESIEARNTLENILKNWKKQGNKFKENKKRLKGLPKSETLESEAELGEHEKETTKYETLITKYLPDLLESLETSKRFQNKKDLNVLPEQYKSKTAQSENKKDLGVLEKETNGNETNNLLRFPYLARNTLENILKNLKKSRKKLKESKQQLKVIPEQYEIETLASKTELCGHENETTEDEGNNSKYCPNLQESVEIKKEAETKKHLNFPPEQHNSKTVLCENKTTPRVLEKETSANERHNTLCLPYLQESIEAKKETENILEKWIKRSKILQENQKPFKILTEQYERETVESENETELSGHENKSSEDEKNNTNYISCLEIRKRAENILKKKTKCNKKFKGDKKYTKVLRKRNERETAEIQNTREISENETNKLKYIDYSLESIKTGTKVENYLEENKKNLNVLTEEFESETVIKKNKTETIDRRYFNCIQESIKTRKRVENFLKKLSKSNKNLKENTNHAKIIPEQNEKQTNFSKTSLKGDIFLTPAQLLNTIPELGAIKRKDNEKCGYTNSKESQYSRVSGRQPTKYVKNVKKEQHKEMDLPKTGSDDFKTGEKYRAIELKNKVEQESPKTKAIRWNLIKGLRELKEGEQEENNLSSEEGSALSMHKNLLIEPISSNYSPIRDCSTPLMRESLPSLSPKTEEEHFEFYEPKEKLNKQHISHLIKLYHEHPRLWDQSHPDFCEPQVCRKSWQQITDQWNEFCKRNFTITEVRIRICTLCQRFIQERERLALEGELDECAKFPYYEQLQFLEQQKSLKMRRELYDQQNEKILEIYQQFPILWHVSCYKLKQAKDRAKAFESISKALKLNGLHLSSVGIQKRIRSLRKCYRLEKIRYLHAQVEQTPFSSEFRHYERMKFLHKHIDPFVCCICGRIFENLQGFRQHLQAENHGSVLPEDSGTESDVEKGTEEEHTLKNNSNGANQGFNENEANFLASSNVGTTKQTELDTLVFPPYNNHMEYFSESENSGDILQRFTPLSSTPNHMMDSVKSSQLDNLENQSSNIQEDLNLPSYVPRETIIQVDALCLENQLMEKIMENVTNNDTSNLGQQGLEEFINAVTSCEELFTDNCITEETFNPEFLHTDNTFVVEHPDIVTDQAISVLSPRTVPDVLYTENASVVEHPDIVTDRNFCVLSPQPDMETFVPNLLQADNNFVMEYPDAATNVLGHTTENLSPPKAATEKSAVEQSNAENHPALLPLVAKVQCADFSIDLNLEPEPPDTFNPSHNDSDNEFYTSADISTIPLPDHFIHNMIELYRKFPPLWDPNHLDYNSRILRRQAWCALTAEFNSAMGTELSWRTLHRKLTDYSKYYKKLITEQKDYEQLEHKWTFYENFKFMDDVIAVQDELQRNVHHRDNNFKIIAIYKTLPQLWDIKHPEYNKRSTKQRNIELMCNRLQEENNLQLTTERLKNRLIELRTQYRAAKKQRLKCLQNQQQFSSEDFEFYEALNFLDDHIDPFICAACTMEFKKLTDYNQHIKREHSPKAAVKNRTLSLLPHEPGMENICHICGIKFSTRSNLVHHVKRHEGIRNYECTMCPKKFYASHSLKIHIRSHTKECPYTCEKCGISFVSASKLNQHIKRHLNRKNFQCDFCPKTFFTAFEKDRHERRHLNIRDKACPICGKTFVAGSSYYAHLMLHSDRKRFECDKCNMKFAQYAGLYKHKKRHHT